jgi:hypothetical protein
VRLNSTAGTDQRRKRYRKARRLADLSTLDFHRLLGDREVERHDTGAELDEDLEYARE